MDIALLPTAFLSDFNLYLDIARDSFKLIIVSCQHSFLHAAIYMPKSTKPSSSRTGTFPNGCKALWAVDLCAPLAMSSSWRTAMMRRVHREVRATVSLRGVVGTDMISDLVERGMWMVGIGKDVDFKRKICLKTYNPLQRDK
jgi:hypothetical protein